ncbi:MAG: cyclic lactone autoinducer peptide [Clostridioides sp.]|jgi:cyclic lactone autoinducer peptide|nr:cyclic lactone autoinducer peptide [Clostridioides sp.]
MNRLIKNEVSGKVIASVGRKVAEMNANSACALIFHQPKMPKQVKKLRKF